MVWSVGVCRSGPCDVGLRSNKLVGGGRSTHLFPHDRSLQEEQDFTGSVVTTSHEPVEHQEWHSTSLGGLSLCWCS